MRVLNYEKYLPAKIGVTESFALPTTSSEGKDLGQHVALQVTEAGKMPQVVAFGVISRFVKGDDEEELAAHYVVDKIRLLDSPFTIPPKQYRLGEGATQAAQALYDPGGVLGGVVGHTGPDHWLCRDCGNSKCPFWHRLHWGDRSHFWKVAGGVKVCPSKTKGKAKIGNANLMPSNDVVRKIGVKGAFSPLNGLAYTWSPPLERKAKLPPRQDTLQVAADKKPDDPVIQEAIATRGDAQIIEKKWCSSCERRNTCMILKHKQTVKGKTVCVDDWIFWGGEPVCISYKSAEEAAPTDSSAEETVAQMSLLPL